MPRFLRKLPIFVILALALTACSQKNPSALNTPEAVITLAASTTATTEIVSTNLPVATDATTIDPTITAEPIVEINNYAECGAGELIQVPYFFKDVNGVISPTQIVRTDVTTDGVRSYVSVISCLKYDEGKTSNPDEVENGYENEIIFFDKYGKGHTYRIIIGGHYVNPYDPKHKDITGIIDDTGDTFLFLEDWKNITRNYFKSNGVRQIGVDIYLEDTDGDLSKVLRQTYSFRDTNNQIGKALTIGEGYPEQVPDGFFLFATRTWLIKPD